MNDLRYDWLRWRAQASPGKLAVLWEERSVSYAELDHLAGGLAAGLAALGVHSGARGRDTHGQQRGGDRAYPCGRARWGSACAIEHAADTCGARAAVEPGQTRAAGA